MLYFPIVCCKFMYNALASGNGIKQTKSGCWHNTYRVPCLRGGTAVYFIQLRYAFSTKYMLSEAPQAPEPWMIIINTTAWGFYLYMSLERSRNDPETRNTRCWTPSLEDLPLEGHQRPCKEEDPVEKHTWIWAPYVLAPLSLDTVPTPVCWKGCVYVSAFYFLIELSAGDQ